MVLEHWREIYVRSSPQQREAHPLQYRETTVTPALVYTLPFLLLKKGGRGRKEQKNPSFNNISLHILLNNPH